MTRSHSQAPAPGRTTSMVPSRAGSAVGASATPSPTTSRSSTPQPGGGARMVFRPVMPQRRRTPGASLSAAKDEAATHTASPSNEATRVKGRTAGPRPASRPRGQIEMTATGPFAMGHADRSTSRSMTKAAAMMAAPAPSSEPSSSTVTPKPMGSSDVDGPTNDTIDIERVQDLDAMAPQSLLHAPPSFKREPTPSKAEETKPQPDVNLSQALDLSESEDEDAEDATAPHFADTIQRSLSTDHLFLFQFPHTFPTFHRPDESQMAVQEPAKTEDVIDIDTETHAAAPPRPEGQMGHLDIYADGRVMLRIGDMPFDVVSGSETSFLQQVMVLDAERQQAQCLGDLDGKLIVTPNLDYLMANARVAPSASHP